MIPRGYVGPTYIKFLAARYRADLCKLASAVAVRIGEYDLAQTLAGRPILAANFLARCGKKLWTQAPRHITKRYLEGDLQVQDDRPGSGPNS